MSQRRILVTSALPYANGSIHIGHLIEHVKRPEGGPYSCITARDQLHSLRSCVWAECANGVYTAVFTGDPASGGNRLITGNLDGYKKENPEASHDVVDILDFGHLVAGLDALSDPHTPCGTMGPHADINGDGEVDGLDFSKIAMNFLLSSAPCCGGGTTAGITVGRTEVSVRELRQMGLGELAVGDLNNDGWLDLDDMAAFKAGARPGKKPSPRVPRSSR